MDVPDEERRAAEKTGVLVGKKLLEIMDLQADIDALLREKHPTPFGSGKWKNCRPESLQRLVLLTAIQFVLFEPVDWVPDGLTWSSDDSVRISKEDFEVRKIYGFERTGTGPNGEVLGSFLATGYLPTFLDELIVRGLIRPGERYL